MGQESANGIHPAVPRGARRNGGRDVEMEPYQPLVMARITVVKQTPSNKSAVGLPMLQLTMLRHSTDSGESE